MTIEITVRNLLEAGMHFGHQTQRWNPKMKPFIFEAKNKIHILDVQQSVAQLENIKKLMTEVGKSNKTVLFIGTKKQAKDAVEEVAVNTGMPYVKNRWLGGTLTNFSTISRRLKRLKDLKEQKEQGYFETLSKKEAATLNKELAKLERMIGGIAEMNRIPDYVFIIDTVRERNAVLEARKLNIPIISPLDSNCDPDEVTYGIVGNDDAIKSIQLITQIISDGILEGKNTIKE